MLNELTQKNRAKDPLGSFKKSSLISPKSESLSLNGTNHSDTRNTQWANAEE
jgi:hypothetical protein